MNFQNAYLVIICGAVIVLVLHTMNNNKKPDIYLGEGKKFSKNVFTDQIKINSQGKTEVVKNKADVSETHQVILHRYIFEKIQEIANEDY